MKRLIAEVAGFAAAVTAVIGACVWGVRLIYGYWMDKAIAEAASSKIWRMDCPNGSPWNCKFTEVPVRIHTFSEVILPTILSSAAALAVLVGLAYLAARQLISNQQE